MLVLKALVAIQSTDLNFNRPRRKTEVRAVSNTLNVLARNALRHNHTKDRDEVSALESAHNSLVSYRRNLQRYVLPSMASGKLLFRTITCS